MRPFLPVVVAAAAVAAADPGFTEVGVCSQVAPPAACQQDRGHLGMAAAAAQVRQRLSPGRGMVVDVIAGGEAADYTGAFTDGLAAHGRFASVWMRGTLVQMLSPAWGGILQAGSTVAGDGHADVGDALLGSGYLGAIHATPGKGFLAFGLVVQTHLVDDPTVLPMPMADWRFNDRLRMQLWDQLDHANRLTWSPEPSFGLGLRCDLLGREYALSPGADAGARAFRDGGVALAAEAAWHPGGNPETWIRGHLGVILERTVRVQDAAGDTRGRVETEPGLVLGLTAQMRL